MNELILSNPARFTPQNRCCRNYLKPNPNIGFIVNGYYRMDCEAVIIWGMPNN